MMTGVELLSRLRRALRGLAPGPAICTEARTRLEAAGLDPRVQDGGEPAIRVSGDRLVGIVELHPWGSSDELIRRVTARAGADAVFVVTHSASHLGHLSRALKARGDLTAIDGMVVRGRVA